MFAIYRKNVGGRIHDRYFKDYDKGFYEYEVRMTTGEGEQASFAIIDGYFED